MRDDYTPNLAKEEEAARSAAREWTEKDDALLFT